MISGAKGCGGLGFSSQLSTVCPWLLEGHSISLGLPLAPEGWGNKALQSISRPQKRTDEKANAWALLVQHVMASLLCKATWSLLWKWKIDLPCDSTILFLWGFTPKNGRQDHKERFTLTVVAVLLTVTERWKRSMDKENAAPPYSGIFFSLKTWKECWLCSNMEKPGGDLTRLVK